jgi:hypothetical protein
LIALGTRRATSADGVRLAIKGEAYGDAAVSRVSAASCVLRFFDLRDFPESFRSTISAKVRVRYQRGTDEVVQFFPSPLKYSRWAEVTVVADQQVESLVRAFGRSPRGVWRGAAFDKRRETADHDHALHPEHRGARLPPPPLACSSCNPTGLSMNYVLHAASLQSAGIAGVIVAPAAKSFDEPEGLSARQHRSLSRSLPS